MKNKSFHFALSLMQPPSKINTEYSGLLACPFEFGHALVIVAKSPDSGDKCHLNLRCGKDEPCNIGLHLSVRFRENIIVRNSKISKEWGVEERAEHLDKNATPNPIIQGDFFTICIFAEETKFHIAINNRPYCTYEYRVPVKSIRAVELNEHIHAVKRVDHRQIFPYAWPPIQSLDPKIAFSNDIPILFTPGHVIVIKARVYGNNKGAFILNFHETDTRRELMHFNPRFEPYNFVARNTRKEDFKWGPEERDGKFPFVFDQQFCLAIAFTEKDFKFAVDGTLFTSFTYRVPDLLELLTGFKIVVSNGMEIDVTKVDHLQLPDVECKGFQMYCNLMQPPSKMYTEYSGLLACPFEFGHALVIVAKSPDSGDKCHLNLRCGKDEPCNIGLHLSVRFRENIIVRNSKISKKWGVEERAEHLDKNATPNPIIQGDFFIICIFAGETKFHISINNRPYCTYEYRVPVKSIRAVELNEHIHAVKRVDHRRIFPYAWPPIQSLDPKIAFSNDIPILFTPGHVIVIKARVYGNNKGAFILNFHETDTRRELMHFNPRFEPYNFVARNTRKEDFKWGPEERDGKFPFVFDQQFCLAIAFTEKDFKFAVDGTLFTSFTYRVPDLLELLTGFKIVVSNGMEIDVTKVDHLQLPDVECKGFQMYCKYDIDII